MFTLSRKCSIFYIVSYIKGTAKLTTLPVSWYREVTDRTF